MPMRKAATAGILGRTLQRWRKSLAAERLATVPDGSLRPGLQEALLTRRLEELLAQIPEALVIELEELRNAEASDRVSRHLAGLVVRAIDLAPEGSRGDEAIRIAAGLIRELEAATGGRHDLAGDEPTAPGRVLAALLRRRPDGQPETIDRPLTPLVDTTIFTNAPGEPA